MSNPPSANLYYSDDPTWRTYFIPPPEDKKNQEVKRDGKHILLNEANKKKGSIKFDFSKF